jgi:mRNA-degrading endonuclease RelE of RelBE toxin-antitoxin system
MAKKGKAHRPLVSGASLPSPVSSAPFDVDMTATAEATYKDLYRAAKAAEQRGDYASPHITKFEMVRDAIKRIIPAEPLSKKHALRGELSNLFRLKKGRMRICWIASSKLHRVCIMFISETLRKAGDASDPYAILHNMVDSGTFDAIFTQFGVRMPRLKNRTDKTQ